MKTLHVQRICEAESGTLGTLRFSGSDGITCFTLEDPYRARKIAGETRIPQGRYPLRWRQGGRWAARFQARLGVPGSLEICDVPGFSDVLVHAGNTKRDTAGCLLLGLGADVDRGVITRSRDACRAVYHHVHEAGGAWWIEIS